MKTSTYKNKGNTRRHAFTHQTIKQRCLKDETYKKFQAVRELSREQLSFNSIKGRL